MAAAEHLTGAIKRKEQINPTIGVLGDGRHGINAS
jgi:hypothetical protein